MAFALITVAFMVALFLLSSTRPDANLSTSPIVWLAARTPRRIQKAMHVLLYSVLAWLCFAALEPLDVTLLLHGVLAFTIAAGFGAFNERYQTRVPGRYGSLGDVLLNSVGAVLGLLIAAL